MSTELVSLEQENSTLKKQLAVLEIKARAQAASTKSEAKVYDNTEPILAENPGRFVIFPIKHDAVWKMVRAPACRARAAAAFRLPPALPPPAACRARAGRLTLHAPVRCADRSVPAPSPVQASRGKLLDCGGDRSCARHERLAEAERQRAALR